MVLIRAFRVFIYPVTHHYGCRSSDAPTHRGCKLCLPKIRIGAVKVVFITLKLYTVIQLTGGSLRVKTLPHALKHGLTEHEVAYAWQSPLRCRQRHGTDDPTIWIAIGILPDGRFAELVAFLDEDAYWCVFHAKTPPTKKFFKELEMRYGRR